MDIGNITNGILTNLGESVQEEDYVKGEYLYCGKCNEPKAKIRRNTKGETLTIPMRCKCLADSTVASAPRGFVDWTELEEKRKEEEKRDRLIRLDQNRRKAFDDIRLRDWTFANDDKTNEISSVAEKYADNFYTMLQRGKGLLLYGGVGTGKSYMAACIVNAVLEQDYACRFTNFSRLANALLGCEFGEKQEFLDSLQRYKLLVIDDLGSERNTEFMNEVVYSVIDARHISQLPLIVTTNLTGDELKHPNSIESERVFSRLFEMCYPYEVKGKDRRKLKLKENSKRFKELLGYGEE